LNGENQTGMEQYMNGTEKIKSEFEWYVNGTARAKISISPMLDVLYHLSWA